MPVERAESAVSNGLVNGGSWLGALGDEDFGAVGENHEMSGGKILWSI